MQEPLIELQQMAETARAKRGRMDSATRSRAAELIASIWRETPDNASETTHLFDDLDSEAVAEAVSKMWSTLPPEHRSTFKKALYKPTTERTVRRLVMLVRAVMSCDAATAFEWLQLVLPGGKPRITKDVQQAISNLLFSSPAPAFEAISTADAESTEIIRIYESLWTIAKTAPKGSSLMSRVKLAQAFTKYLTSRDLWNSYSGDFRADLGFERETWPMHVREAFDGSVSQSINGVSMPGRDSEGASTVSIVPADASTFSSKHREEQSKSVTSPPGPPQGNRSVPRATDTPRSHGAECAKWMDSLFENAQSDLATLTKLRTMLNLLAEGNESLEEKLRKAQNDHRDREREMQVALSEHLNRAVQLESRFVDEKTAFEREKLRLEARTKDAENQQLETIANLSHVQRELKRVEQERELEKERLNQQISATALARVDEFRRRLAGSLNRLAQDLPAKDALVSSDLGTAVLLLFHQFIEVLQEERVPVRAGRGL